MREHVKILGILNIIMGSLGAVGGLVVFLVLGGVAGFVSAAGGLGGSDEDMRNAAVAAPILVIIGICIAAFLLLLSLPTIIAGWGLLKFRPWSRVFAIIVSAFHLLHVPLGTALGIYGLWVLLNEETRRLLESGGYYNPVAGQTPYAARNYPAAPPPPTV
jgi:hypothetical protein